MESATSVWVLGKEGSAVEQLEAALRAAEMSVVREQDANALPVGLSPDVLVLTEGERAEGALKARCERVLVVGGETRSQQEGRRYECLPADVQPGDAAAAVRFLATVSPETGAAESLVSDFDSTLQFVRILSLLGGQRVLTMTRGLRRGEIRFHEGEVTAAQLGILHGQAAFHQLLLWSDARCYVHDAEVVRRQQIPLEPEVIFSQAEDYLESLQEVGGATPQDRFRQVASVARDIRPSLPTEVRSILDLFDGARSVADVIEDCPFRSIEVLRVTEQFQKMGVLTPVAEGVAKERLALVVEDWQVEPTFADGTTAGELPVMPRGKSAPGNQGHWVKVAKRAEAGTDSANSVVPASTASGVLQTTAAQPSETSQRRAPSIEIEEELIAAAELPEPVETPVVEAVDRADTDKTPTFTDDETAFFNRGAKPQPTVKVESFEDLDADLELPKTFWGRFFRDPNAPLEKQAKKTLRKPKRNNSKD